MLLEGGGQEWPGEVDRGCCTGGGGENELYGMQSKAVKQSC